MKIPIKYNLRSLWVRKAGTAMTALGIGLTVAIIVVITSMVSGLNSTFTTTGDPLQLIVLRKGAQNEVNSYFNRETSSMPFDSFPASPQTRPARRWLSERSR